MVAPHPGGAKTFSSLSLLATIKLPSLLQMEINGGAHCWNQGCPAQTRQWLLNITNGPLPVAEWRFIVSERSPCWPPGQQNMTANLNA